MNHLSPGEPAGHSISKVRYIFGGILLAAALLSPLLVPFVTSSELPGNWKAILSTGLIVGLPEVGILLAVAVLGRQGFARLKEMFFSKIRRITEPASVSMTRYRIGLFMFFIPLLLAAALCNVSISRLIY